MQKCGGQGRGVIGFILVLVLGCLTFGSVSSAYGAAVRVELPSFKVMLNGKMIKYEQREYPLIVYGGITYFPMTYHDSRFLGLETSWEDESGLAVMLSEVAGAYFAYPSTRNVRYYTAETADFLITVNGERIDNAVEEYPLLVFRNVTYFPLTWRFAVDEFGWEYSYDDEQGLIIDSGNSGALDLITADLPVVGDYIASEDYFYYEGPDRFIYQAPISYPSQAKKVIELPIWVGGGGDGVRPVNARFEYWDGELYLLYRQGGASMGTDYQFRLNPDGTYTEMKATERNFGEVNIWTMPLTIGGGSWLEISCGDDGDTFLINGALSFVDYGTTMHGGRNVFVQGHDVYLLARDSMSITREEELIQSWEGEGARDNPALYKIDTLTGQGEKLTDDIQEQFILQNDYLYFLNDKHELCRMNLSGTDMTVLVNEAISQFIILGDDVYYCPNSETTNGNGLYRLSDGKQFNSGGDLWEFKIQAGYLFCLFGDTKQNPPYEKIIINSAGQPVYQSGDRDEKVLIHGVQLIMLRDNFN